MRLGRISRIAIFFAFWSFLTVFIAIKTYDEGYKKGVDNTTKIFLYFQKEYNRVK